MSVNHCGMIFNAKVIIIVGIIIKKRKKYHDFVVFLS